MLAWAQSELNRQLEERMINAPQWTRAYVCSLPGVKNRKDEIFTGARECHMELMSDLQAAIESDIQFDGMRRMVMRCLLLEVPGTSPLFSLQTLFELRATHQQASRHDDLRAEVRTSAPRVAPDPNGPPLTPMDPP